MEFYPSRAVSGLVVQGSTRRKYTTRWISERGCQWSQSRLLGDLLVVCNNMNCTGTAGTKTGTRTKSYQFAPMIPEEIKYRLAQTLGPQMNKRKITPAAEDNICFNSICFFCFGTMVFLCLLFNSTTQMFWVLFFFFFSLIMFFL